MILSTNFLNYSLIEYNNENIRNKENYNKEEEEKCNKVVFLYIAIIFAIVEFILLYYAVIISLRIARNNAERIIFIILSITYTIPFLLFMIVFNEDARKSLA
jgi:hypothetical protein